MTKKELKDLIKYHQAMMAFYHARGNDESYTEHHDKKFKREQQLLAK